MSYQVLARKYRPRSFETLVGQEHVVRALTHALESGRLHHAYLFTGTRGVGKTTLSRILAKSLNCETGITAQPCGVCDACVAIDAGRFVDYIEMDAASNRGVDEMAQLLEQAVYAPSNARFKVYMIDEVHMLTNHAFNSMLKTLEEPPEHVKFILATTDPQKIPVTVLSRCLQFNLKQMPPGHIIGHLENILGQEQIAFDTPALRLLAQGAHGSMRDALSLTDQAIAYAAGKVTLEAVQGMLGALDQSYLIRLLDALAQHDGAGLLAIADEMASRSLSYNVALQDLGTLLHRIALAQAVPAAVPDDVPERDDIMRLAGILGAEDVQLYYQIAVHGRNELGLAPDEYAGFSMTLLRMLAFHPDTGGDDDGAVSPAASGATLQQPGRAAPRMPASAAGTHVAQAAAQAVQPVAPVTASAVSSSAAALQMTRPAGAVNPARAALDAARAAGRPQPGSNKPAPKLVSIAGASAQAEVSAPPWEDASHPWADEKAADALRPQAVVMPIRQEAVNEAVQEVVQEAQAPVISLQPAVARPKPEAKVDSVLVLHPVPALGWDGNWPLLASSLAVRGVAQQLAMQTELITCEHAGEVMECHLRVPLDTLRSAANTEKLAAALSEHFGIKVRVSTEVGPVVHTASALAEAQRAARQQAADATVESDPFVQSLMRELGATIVPGSIRPGN